MKEKRRYKRFIIEGMDVQCKMFYATDVTVVNMSFNGICLHLSKRLNLGEEYTLKLESTGSSLSVTGVVVWEKLTGRTVKVKNTDLPIYEVGMRFDGVLTNKGNELIDFISGSLPDKAIKTRIQGLRVKISRPEKSIILDDRDNYSVKMIGLGGMLIESRKELHIDERFFMELTFPESDRPLRLWGRTAYCMEIPGKTPKCYDSGIEFMDMNDKQRAQLKEFIEILETL